MEEFNQIVGRDEEWSFKALKQLVKLSLFVEEKEKVLKYYKDVVGMINLPVISKNYGEKSLSNLIERLSCRDTLFMENIYKITLEGLKGVNERLWIKIALRLTNINIQEEKVSNAENILQELLQVSIQETQLLELYSFAIQLYTLTDDLKKVRFYYEKTLKINSAIPHPRILGVIKECGGKMLMREKKWDAARENFFESFKNYDEAGSIQRIQVLKYYVLACMLSESGINPFESQETKPYKDDPRILVMMQLVNAFQKSDIDEFNRLVHSHEREIMSDKFVRIFFDDLMLSVRSQGIINIVKSYTRISLVQISSLLSLDVESVEIILMKLILDRRLVNSKIDMINGILEVDYNSYTVNDEPQIKMTSILPERYRDSELDQIRQQEQHTIASGEVTDIAPQIVQRSNALLSWMDISSTLHSSLANNTRNG